MATLKTIKSQKIAKSEETFFLLGWVAPGEREFPFHSEKDRMEKWQKNREDLLAKMYLPRATFEPFRGPSGNRLRPAEWWLRESSELKLILNDAKRLHTPHLFNKEPLLETDKEYLERLGLLNDDDRKYIQTEDFKEAEKRDLEYRNYKLTKVDNRSY